MAGTNPDDLEHLSVDDLHRRLKAESIHSSLAARIRGIIERKTHAAQLSHRENELLEWAALHKTTQDLRNDVRKIEGKVENPKSEWRTLSLWVAVIALVWQIGEKIPWRSLLPTPATIDAQKASASIPLLPAHSPESYQQSPDGSKSEAPVESSPQKAATESPLSKTPAEHPKE